MREAWIDRLKGILILLVVLGHAAGSAYITAPKEVRPILAYVYQAIYFFHMPAFFVVAGMLWKRPDLTFGAFALKKMKRLLVPFWCFGLLSVVIYWVFAGWMAHLDGSGYWAATKGGGTWWSPFFVLATGSCFPGTDGFRCNSVLWFLPCMFMMQCCYWLVDRKPRPLGWKVALGIACLLGRPMMMRSEINWWPAQINEVVHYLPYFLLGVMGREWLRRLELKAPHMALLMAGYMLLAGVVPYESWRLPIGVRLIAPVGMAAMGTVVCVVVAKFCLWQLLARFGIASLGVMLLHKFLVLALQTLALKGPAFLRDGFWAFFMMVVAFAMAAWGSLAATRIVQRVCPWALGETTVRRCE